MVATKPAQVRYAQDHMKPVQLNGQTYNFKQLQALIGSLPDAEKKNYPFTYYNGKDAQGHIRLKVVLKLTPETKAVLARAAEKANFLN